jgi:hypothetical protein
MREHTRKNNKLITKLKKQMDAACSEGGWIDPRHGGSVSRRDNGLVYWAVIGQNGETHHDPSQQCHVGLNSTNGVERWFLLNRLQFGYNPRPVSDEIIDAYLLYLTKQSPYRDAFYRKGGKTVREYGYVVMDTTAPANQMSSALVAVRMIWEWSGTIPFVWYQLVRQGVHPDVAYCHAYQVECKDHENVSTNRGVYSHTSWGGNSFTKGQVKNYLTNNMVNANAPYYNKGLYAPMTRLYGNFPKGLSGYEWTPGSYLQAGIPAIAEQAKSKKVGTRNVFKMGIEEETVKVGDFFPLWAEFLKKSYGDVGQWIKDN